jgi:hypothetical protein
VLDWGILVYILEELFVFQGPRTHLTLRAGYVHLILWGYWLHVLSTFEFKPDQVPRAVHADVIIALDALKNLVEIAKADRAHVRELLAFLLLFRSFIPCGYMGTLFLPDEL